MPNKTVEFEAKTLASEVSINEIDTCRVEKSPNGKEYAVRTGTVNVYDDVELSKLKAAGLSENHATLLNQIIVIRAQDAVRLQMRGSNAVSAEQKALGKKLDALLKAGGEKAEAAKKILASLS